jgi:hypothetical protein
MGGTGSGNHYHWHRAPKKTTVEASLSIDAGDWTRRGIINAGVRHRGTWRWTYPSGKEFAIAYDVDARDMSAPSLHLAYSWTVSGSAPQSKSYVVPLTTTQPRFGGLRWWFRCPLSRRGAACGRRVGKLYMPPQSGWFGCRQCHDLTYTSCQESGKADWLYRVVAEGTGCSVREVKRILGGRT